MLKADYAYYLKTSLEVDEFLRPQVLTPPQPVAKVLVGFYVAEDLSPEALGLFEKMVAAIGLTSDQIKLWNLSELNNPLFQCQWGVVFTKDLLAPQMGQWQQSTHPQAWLTTYSPSVLLQHPEFKKSAWEHLKLLKAKIAL